MSDFKRVQGRRSAALHQFTELSPWAVTYIVAVAAIAAVATWFGRNDGVGPIEYIGLRPGEKLVAMRQQALLDIFDGARLGPLGGRLYLTSQRLLHAGPRETRQIELKAIDEVGPSGERLLITLSNGDGWALQLDGPRVLRVAMAELLAAAR